MTTSKKRSLGKGRNQSTPQPSQVSERKYATWRNTLNYQMKHEPATQSHLKNSALKTFPIYDMNSMTSHLGWAGLLLHSTGVLPQARSLHAEHFVIVIMLTALKLRGEDLNFIKWSLSPHWFCCWPSQGGHSFAVSYLLNGIVPLVRVSSDVFVCASMLHIFFWWLEMAAFFDCALSWLTFS